MANKIILKENDLSTFSNPPSGYKFIGYNNTTFSEKLSNGDVNPIGGSLSDVKSITLTLSKTEINNLNTATVSIPFASFDALSGDAIIILPNNLISEVNSDGLTFSTGFSGGVRIVNSEAVVVAFPLPQSSIQSDGIYYGNGGATAVQKVIPDAGFYMQAGSGITGGGTSSSVTIKLLYQSFS